MMRDYSLLIFTIGAILVKLCSSDSQGFDGSGHDEPVRMASESLVVKSYKDAESSTVSTTPDQGEFEEFQVYQGVMGRPGIDFPVYPYIPATNFNCRGVKKSGYYADLATDCQVFHICDGNRKISFLCPNGTIFRQSHLICDWWFRVDCGKSVELYEESAEQLAADQKIYKARSEERERRRKTLLEKAKTAAEENGGELTSSEVYALDEPFHIRKQPDLSKTHQTSSTTRSPPLRFEGRKAERHSKKVVESGSSDKFPSYNRDKATSRAPEKIRTFKDRTEGIRQFSTAAPVSRETKARVSFADTTEFSTATTPIHSTVGYKSRFTPQNSINFESNKENIQPAESGSIVEDLNRNNNYYFNQNQQKQRLETNTNRDKTNTYAYNDRKTEENGNRNSNFAYNSNIKTEEQVQFNNKPRGNNFNYNSRGTEQISSSNQNGKNNFGYNNRKTEQTFTNNNNQNVKNNFSYNTGTQQTPSYNNQNVKNNFSFEITRSQEITSGEQYKNLDNYENKKTEVVENVNGDKNINAGFGDNRSYVSKNATNVATYNDNQKQTAGNFQFGYSNAQNTGEASITGNNKALTDSVVHIKTEQSFESNSNNNNNNFNIEFSDQKSFVSSRNNATKSTYSSKNQGSEQTSGNFQTDLNAGPTTGIFNANNKAQNTNTAYTSNGNAGFSESTIVGEAYNKDKNINFDYNSNLQTSASYGDNNTTSDNKKLEENFDVGVTAYTTEYPDYESKRTSFVDRQETTTAQTRHSSRYRTSTPQYVEHENQFFAETASFASNRGGKSYDYHNHFQGYNYKGSTSSPDYHKTTNSQTSKTSESYSTSAPYVYSQPTQVTDFYRTTTQRPVKQNSRKVTFYPTTPPQTAITNRIWQTTTFAPYGETTTENGKYTVENVYFTTTTPERDVEFLTQGLGVTQKQNEYPTEDYIVSTIKPDVDISLQELNINKGSVPSDSDNRTYADYIREGLEVPPSSGPNALRSFALYFATTRSSNEEPKTSTFETITEPVTTVNPFEAKKKGIVQEVDDIVQKSSFVGHDFTNKDSKLPNSLTEQTKESYSALFPNTSENKTEMSERSDLATENEFGTTGFELFTEEPNRINTELTKNDLDGSQSRGLVEPEHSDSDYKVSPDLRELAQVFTKALSAYLDDPEAFRRVLSEIRPTEPTDAEISSTNPIEYPSATQEDDEVLDFSDVTKSSYRKKTSTINVRETTTEYFTEPPTTSANDVENFVLPVNHSSWATNIELTAPLLESLDQSQSSYYTPPPFIGTTNAIAEEINNEFGISDKLPVIDSNEAVDSYLPIRGSVDDSSLPRYGGFQNNTKSTTKYVPYGAELTSTTYLPYGADLTSSAAPISAKDDKPTTFNPSNVTTYLSHFGKNETEEDEIQLAKELNNLVLLQKFTTPRGVQKDTTTPESIISTTHFTTPNDINYQDVKLGNGETLEKNVRAGKSLHFPQTIITSNSFEEINQELTPPSSTPKGFLITFSLGGSSTSERATYLPKETTPVVQPTTYSPFKDKQTTLGYVPETPPPTPGDFPDKITQTRSATEYFTTIAPTTISLAKSTKSFERIAELQETLMFNTDNPTVQQKDQARVTVEEMMDKLNMTDSTAHTLMKMMEMAAKNETYRRLVLLLVNDKSGKNKTIEEARLSLLKALLTPVINPQQTRTVVPIPETSKLVQTEQRRRNGSRRSKSIHPESDRNFVSTTEPTTTPRRSSNGKNVRRVKISRGLARSESNYDKSSGLGNLGVIRRTIENSKNKQVKINSVDDAILDSDSRAVELLRSLYSLAARWG